MKSTPNFRYVALADELEGNISNGIFSPGEKLPSLRKLHTQLGLSISTIHQAYIELEKRGRVQVKEKSGFYVKALKAFPLNKPPKTKGASKPSRVTVNALAETIIADLQNDEILALGAAIPSPSLMPLKQLSRIIKSTPSNVLQTQISKYDICSGNAELREELAKRMLGYTCNVTPQDIVTTSGCIDAVGLCLRAVAKPGDTILVESPAFHCFLQLIEDLNMYVLELPGCPEDGIDPESFKKTVLENNVKACLLNSNFQNPLGSVVPTRNKQDIVKIIEQFNIPLIEDDIYGDLYFGSSRPVTFKSFDTKGLVLYCSSFSKTLAPGLRIGWTVPGKFLDHVIRLKLNSYLASSETIQAATAEFLKTGAYDRHLRKLRNQVKNQASALAIAVSKYFPPDTKITFPKGGMFIWVQLNEKIDSMKVYQQAYERKISILPGVICSSSHRYRNCIRINCGLKWDEKVESGIQVLGKIIEKNL